MSDVFVSYKAEDRRRVKPLVEALEADGYSVWWDAQIGGGAQWRHMIEAELNAAKCVIVVWSKRAVAPEGTFVQDEATRAQERHVYVPVLIDKVHLPLGFGEMQALPLSGWKGDRADPHYQSLLSAVARLAGEAGAPAKPHSTHPAVSRRTVLAGGAVATVAVAGVGGWALLRPTAADASNSIAVLPFANLSGDPAQAYFSDGIAEELRSALARLAGLQVVGRTSSEAVRDDDAETAAKKLGVANILSGSDRQSPSTIRVTAELIDGGTGMNRWSEDYDRAPGDTIKIQTDIAENVASALSAALGGAARAAIGIGGTKSPEAQRLFMRAKAMSNNPASKPGMQQGLQLLDSAIAIDPDYADAYALKSIVLNAYGNNYASGAQELARIRAESLQLARTALRIAPNLPQSHMAMSAVYANDLQMAPAFAAQQRALQLAPSDVNILSRASYSASRVGNTDEALRLADQAIALDPLNKRPYNARITALYDARRYGEAVGYGTELQRKSPQLFDNAMTVADSLLLLGRLGEAQTYYSRQTPDYWWRLTGETMLLIKAGDRAGAQAKLETLRGIHGDTASYQYGEIYAQLGDKDRAIAALDRAFEIKDAGLLNMQTDPFLDPLRSDPRFKALVTKMNFPA